MTGFCDECNSRIMKKGITFDGLHFCSNKCLIQYKKSVGITDGEES